MVGSKSTPVISRTFNFGRPPLSSTSTNNDAHVADPANVDRHRGDTADSVVRIADPMKLHKMLRDEPTTGLIPPNGVQHTKEELMYYLKRIQSGEKPDPVELPVTMWPKGGRPLSLGSSVGGGVVCLDDLASSSWSQLSTPARTKKQEWMYSQENPAVVRIGGYHYDGAASDTTSLTSERREEVHQEKVREMRSRMQKLLKSHETKINPREQVLLNPEQSPMVERLRRDKMQEKKILAQLRSQQPAITQHLAHLSANLRPTKHGIISRSILKEELSKLLCNDDTDVPSSSGGSPNMSSKQGSMKSKDLDRLLFSLGSKHLDVNGNVNLLTLLNGGGGSGPSGPSGPRVEEEFGGEQEKFGGRIMQTSLIPLTQRANPSISMKRAQQNTFTRVIVPDKLSSSFADPRTTFKKKSELEEDMNDDRKKRERHLEIIGQRGMHREALHSERCEMERHKRETKDLIMIESKRMTQKRYSLFLEKESLRRMKCGNKFALEQYKQTNPKRKYQTTQYKQEIGGFHRDAIVAEYNLSRSKLGRGEWHRVFR